jgi:benzoyl-CoA reductase/2-hydroxyglutaryl-CoA dehydratase subunit BcrC/BadD/HgdB
MRCSFPRPPSEAACTELLRELDARAAAGVSAYDTSGPRAMIAGSPSPMGYSKVHHVAESSGFRVVHDESCTGARYYRDLVDETPGDLEDMLEAVADRYFRIDCACFSPNTERIDNVLEAVSAWRVDAVIHGVLQYCHAYDIEARALDKALGKAGVQTLKIVTDYSELDTEQIRVRLEAFREMVEAGSPAGS